MEDRRLSPARPRPVPGTHEKRHSDTNTPIAESNSRTVSTARLASSIPQSVSSTPAVRKQSSQSQINTTSGTPLAGNEGSGSAGGPGRSALAAALETAYGRTPPRYGTPPARAFSPPNTEPPIATPRNDLTSNYGSFDTKSAMGGHGRSNSEAVEDPEIVRRHLVTPGDLENRSVRKRSAGGLSPSRRDSVQGGKRRGRDSITSVGLNDDEFSSLQLQGGDITRQVYRWTEDADPQSRSNLSKRSRSFHVARPEPEGKIYDINSIKEPGGFRRNYIRRAANHDSPSRDRQPVGNGDSGELGAIEPRLHTSNFIEFLTLYGHFAGEELEEEDEDDYSDDYFGAGAVDDAVSDDSDREPMENSALLTPKTPGGRRRKRDRAQGGSTTPVGAALLLLKSFVGTGVLFLPKAYKNGGMLFSNVVLFSTAVLSYICFIMLVNTRLKINGSFGDIGGVLYGRHMRNLILSSIVLSQMGFVAAYIVFVSENLQAFTLAVSNCATHIGVKFFILFQLVVFLPLSLIRDINKLGITALIADFFILLGLVYLYYYDIITLVANNGVSDIHQFNPRDWTLFIGTAIFTFEGIGLIIPIQEAMKKPTKFPKVLAFVMVLITVIFMSMGALSYAAYGSSTQTVIILNLPQDDRFVNSVQFLYALAILLSTPLQLFPAIRILENEFFRRSGKFNKSVKWKKNVFRFGLVLACAAIAWAGAGDLDKFVSLIGSFACIPLVYIYPPLLHYKAVATKTWQRVVDLLMCVFGFVVMVYTTSLTIKNWAGSGGPSLPGYCDRSGPS
ncbi:neutral amino acid transporter [Agyrium rufum]|nr:neutral amino acid transporter [Agyrium rufum]